MNNLFKKDNLSKKDLEEIKKYFEAPEPVKKQEFLKKEIVKEQFVRKRISLWYMAWIQFSYISKWLWVFSLLSFAGIFITSRYIDSGFLWGFFAVLPFLVTFSLSESIRSVIYGMREFEMSSRFTIKNIIMARIIITGSMNLFVLFITVLMSGDGTWRNVIYMLVPYLSSATGGFVILRKFPSREGTWLSSVFGLVISLIGLKSVNSYSFIYEARYTGIWIIIVILLFLASGYESYKMADTIGSQA